MENAKSSIKCSYKCNRWLSKSEDDHQIIRELPAIIQGKEPLPGNEELTSECSSDVQSILQALTCSYCVAFYAVKNILQIRAGNVLPAC